MLSPSEGRVHLAGVDITADRPEAIVSRGCSHVPEGRRIFANLSVLENLQMGAYPRRGVEAEGLERVFGLFPRLRERLRLPGGTLSGGEQQMLAIGRALLTRPKLLMLDEPTEGIQPSIIVQIEEAIRRIKRELGLAVLLVEQYLAFAERLADAYVVMAKGSVVAAGAARDVKAETLRQHLAV